MSKEKFINVKKENREYKIHFEEFKKEVKSCLINIQKCSFQEVDKLMKEYENDLKDFYDDNYDPKTVSGGIVIRYL